MTHGSISLKARPPVHLLDCVFCQGVPPLFAQCVEDSIATLRQYTLHDFHSTSKEILQTHDQTRGKPSARVWSNFHEKIDVAIRPQFVSRNRTKDAYRGPLAAMRRIFSRIRSIAVILLNPALGIQTSSGDSFLRDLPCLADREADPLLFSC